MKNYLEIKSKKQLKLAKIPAKSKSAELSDHDYKVILDNNRDKLDEYQNIFYADHKRSLLVIFQGMDTSGKDGAIKHVISGLNPEGCTVINFKAPTANELDHDFLWKAHSQLPTRGQIGIFNRSYYEEVLVTKVHPHLLEKENIPGTQKFDKTFWAFRYRDIVNFEDYLQRQGYEIIKIFIHISKAEQKHRLLSRFEDPHKLWKIEEADIYERGFWQEYQKAYEDCMAATATKANPWYIVPGDDKKRARAAISQLLVDRFERMKLTYPVLNQEQKKSLKKLKEQLVKS